MIALLLAAAASLPVESWDGTEGAGGFSISKAWRAGEFEVQLASVNRGGSGSSYFYLISRGEKRFFLEASDESFLFVLQDGSLALARPKRPKDQMLSLADPTPWELERHLIGPDGLLHRGARTPVEMRYAAWRGGGGLSTAQALQEHVAKAFGHVLGRMPNPGYWPGFR